MIFNLNVPKVQEKPGIAKMQSRKHREPVIRNCTALSSVEDAPY
jgi:hypothetical protein